jgi:hypothetical protein
MFMDVRAGLKETAASLGETLFAPLHGETARRTLVSLGWLFGLAAGVVLIGFHAGIAVFTIAYVRIYGGGWRAALTLTLFGEAFVVTAFDYLITVLWPTPVLLWPFS